MGHLVCLVSKWARARDTLDKFYYLRVVYRNPCNYSYSHTRALKGSITQSYVCDPHGNALPKNCGNSRFEKIVQKLFILLNTSKNSLHYRHKEL